MKERSSAQRAEIRQRFLAVDTANVGDVLDNLGHLEPGPGARVRPLPGHRRQAGRLGVHHPRPDDAVPDGRRRRQDEGLPGPGAGRGRRVWSGDGEGICYFGELIAIGMKERGCAGALVDGGIRDIRWIGEQDFPVYARYRTPVQSIGRWKVTGVPGAGVPARRDHQLRAGQPG